MPPNVANSDMRGVWDIRLKLKAIYRITLKVTFFLSEKKTF